MCVCPVLEKQSKSLAIKTFFFLITWSLWLVNNPLNFCMWNILVSLVLCLHYALLYWNRIFKLLSLLRAYGTTSVFLIVWSEWPCMCWVSVVFKLLQKLAKLLQNTQHNHATNTKSFVPPLLLFLQVEQVKLLDRFSTSNKSLTGTLYLTATHLLFIDSSQRETWVRIMNVRGSKVFVLTVLR